MDFIETEMLLTLNLLAFAAGAGGAYYLRKLNGLVLSHLILSLPYLRRRSFLAAYYIIADREAAEFLLNKKVKGRKYVDYIRTHAQMEDEIYDQYISGIRESSKDAAIKNLLILAVMTYFFIYNLIFLFAGFLAVTIYYVYLESKPFYEMWGGLYVSAQLAWMVDARSTQN